MTEQECLSRMVAPGTPRETKWRRGVIQIIVTSSCDLACFNCTQASNLSRKHWVMSPDQFEQAVLSLKGYFGVYGVFGGNPAISKHFGEYCEILKKHVPFNQRGLWCNHPFGKGKLMRGVFDPSISNLNVHLSREAFDEFRRDWPECSPVGLTGDSRHSPPFVAMKDVVRRTCPTCNGTVEVDSGMVERSEDRDQNIHDGYDPTKKECLDCGSQEELSGTIPDCSRIWELISGCDINQHWSAMIGVFRGQLRAWFCEVAGAQAMLHQDEPDYPDTGLAVLPFKGLWKESGGKEISWWELPMLAFQGQVRRHCFDCGVPLRGYGELSQAFEEKGMDGDQIPREQTSTTHAHLYKPKRKGRRVEVVTDLVQLGMGRLEKMTRYLQNARV